MSTKCPTCGHEYDPGEAPGLKGACPRCMAELLRSQTGDANSNASAGVREDDAPPLAVGAKLHGYEVLEYLGRGGMGFVYKAKQAGLDRVVALKVLAPRLAASPEFAARFGREAKALAALSHPNIVQIYDYGQEGALCFLAMEYVDGTSLRRILSTQRITPETALRYVPQICDALEYAHTAGVVHRDIKPENILIDKRGGLKIADFGLARMAAAAGTPGNQGQDRPTVSGQVMGTPHYMAPEQVENMASVDHRADIYSLGVVFYEMLTGELPLGRFPVPSQRVHVDVRFDEVVLKALEKEPEKRYQRASLVKDDITMIATSEARRDPPAPTSLGKAVITLRARARGTGRVVNWSRFKRGELRDSGWNFGLTTMLTDVVTDIIAECKRIDPACIVAPLFPNGFTTASFDIAIKGKGFQVSCGRRLVRGLFPVNPIAASFGRNYDVLVTISADEPGAGERLADVVRCKYYCEHPPETPVRVGGGTEPRSLTPVWLKVLSAALLLANVIGALMLCQMVIQTHDSFMEKYNGAEYGMLPPLSELMFTVPTSVYVVVLCSLLLALVVKEVAPIRRSVAFWVNVAALALGISFFWFYNLSLYLPLVKMGEILEYRYGLRAWLTREKGQFDFGQELMLTVHLGEPQSQASAETLRKIWLEAGNIDTPPDWHVEATPVEGGSPVEDVAAHIRVQFPSFDWKSANSSLSTPGGEIDFRSPRNTGRNPLPGKYRVVVTAPSFTTEPVEIEIVEPGEPLGNAPAHAPAR